MKQFTCGDVVPGCDAEFQGADDETILADVAVHAVEDHGVAVTAELADQVRSAIRTI